MIVPGPFQVRYSQVRDDLLALQQHARDLLSDVRRDSDAAYKERIKDADSAFEKLETGRYSDFLSIDDLWAATLIVPLHSAKQKVLELLRNCFDVVEIRGRGETQLNPTEFIFDSVRVYCKLRPREGVDAPDITKYKFEVQIKSTLEDAWTSLTRHLVYKEARPNWRLQRLAAQFKAMLENVDLQLDQVESVAKGIEPSPWWRAEVSTKLHELMDGVLRSENFPEVVRPKNISRVTDSTLRILMLSGIVTERNLRQHKFSELDQVCARLLEELPKRAAAYGPGFSLIQLVTGIIIESGGPKKPNRLHEHYVYDLEALASEFPKIKDAGIKQIAI